MRDADEPIHNKKKGGWEGIKSNINFGMGKVQLRVSFQTQMIHIFVFRKTFKIEIFL